MITAVDTNVLLDLFTADPVFERGSTDALRRCLAEGRLVACDIVWAEISGSFATAATAADVLATLGIDFDPVDQHGAELAGAAWAAYRKRGGKRTRVIGDFLIGAHGVTRADRLLTRDRGFYRTYFSRLAVLDPSQT